MKKIYIIAAGLFSMLAACNKDGSSTASIPLAAVNVNGIQSNYTLITHQDFLKINPVVENESSFDFYWTLFNTAFSANQGLIQADTLAKTKNLDYEVLKDPGTYILVFNAREKKTGVTTQLKSTAVISTLTMTGWYLLKDNNGQTDLDFIHPAGRIDNWIKFYNDNAGLSGNAVKSIFVPNFKSTPTSITTFNTIFVLSGNDAAFYRIDNGKMVRNFGNMFFTQPGVRKPEGAFQPTALNEVGFINNGSTYHMVKGGLFGLTATSGSLDYTNMAPTSVVVAASLHFNRTTKNMVSIISGRYTELSNNGGGDKLKNMNADLIWGAGYANYRAAALLLFRNPKDTGYIFRVNGQFGPLAGYGGTIVNGVDTLKPEHSLMHADKICGNYDVDVLYYSIGSDIYLVDLGSKVPSLQFSLPAGEVVTCIQHIKFPEPSGTAGKIDKIAIATYKDGRYKVYLHSISSLRTIQAMAQPDFEGEGRVSSVMYMEQGTGTRLY